MTESRADLLLALLRERWGADAELHDQGVPIMSEKKYRAWLGATATTAVEFTADVDHLVGDDRHDALLDAAYAAFQGVSVCHQCSRGFDLGDFEVGEGPDDIEEVSA